MPKVSRWLVLALLALSPPGCFLNPFPELPGESETADSGPPGAGGSAGTGSGGAPGSGGGISVSGGTSGAEGGSGGEFSMGGTGGSGSGGLAGAPSAGSGGASAGGSGMSAAGSGFGGGFAGAPAAGASGVGVGGAGDGGIGGAGTGGIGGAGDAGSVAAGTGAAGAGGTTDPVFVRGTCDHRQQIATCREVIGTEEVVAAVEETCGLSSGLWSEAACPTTEALIGCCAYTAATTTTYRDCSYQGGAGNPAAECTQMTGGVWTPAD